MVTLAGYCVCSTTVPCSTRILFAPSERMNVIGQKLKGGRPLIAKPRMSAFRRCVDDPEKMVDRASSVTFCGEH
jgi:hypothetical protein